MSKNFFIMRAGNKVKLLNRNRVELVGNFGHPSVFPMALGWVDLGVMIFDNQKGGFLTRVNLFFVNVRRVSWGVLFGSVGSRKDSMKALADLIKAWTWGHHVCPRSFRFYPFKFLVGVSGSPQVVGFRRPGDKNPAFVSKGRQWDSVNINFPVTFSRLTMIRTVRVVSQRG